MSNIKQDAPSNVKTIVGGLTVSWILGDDPKTIHTKSGNVLTLIDLRDPARPARSIKIWLDGDASAFEGLLPGSPIHIQLTSAKGGKSQEELVGEVDRATVEAAFAAARARA